MKLGQKVWVTLESVDSLPKKASLITFSNSYIEVRIEGETEKKALRPSCVFTNQGDAIRHQLWRLKKAKLDLYNAIRQELRKGE